MEETYNIEQVKNYLTNVIDEETEILEKNLWEKRNNFNIKEVVSYV